MPATSRLDGAALRTNRRVVGALVLLQLGLLVAVPTLAPTATFAAAAALVLALMSPSLWAAIHEAIHGHLLAPAEANERAGRMLAILHGAPFDVLRFGHLTHHRTNGQPVDRPDVWLPDTEPRWRATLRFYARLLGGLYLLELAALPAAALPRRILRRAFAVAGRRSRDPDSVGRAERHLLEPARLARIRQDAALIVASWIVWVVLWGPLWPFLAAALLGRAVVISLLDNAPHHGAVVGDRDQGYDTRLPRSLERLILNMNYHGTHHRHPNVPWRALPEAFARDRAPDAGPMLHAVLRQLRGPGPAS